MAKKYPELLDRTQHHSLILHTLLLEGKLSLIVPFVDINVRNRQDLTPLMVVLQNKDKNFTEAMMFRILDLKPDVNAQEKKWMDAFDVCIT